MEEKTCCVTGHRDIPADKVALVEQRLRQEVLKAIEDGYTRFISGFAEGVDLLFAAIVAKEKAKHPDLYLEAALPYAGRVKSLRSAKGTILGYTTLDLLDTCNGVKVESQTYTPACYLQRNRYMVSQSQRVIAVYDGRERGGTLFTMRCAHTLGREVRVIEV